MDTGIMVTAIGYATTLTLAGIGLYIKMTTDAALAKQKHEYLKEQVDKLELRVNEIEHEAVTKLDEMQKSLQKMEINITILLNK